MIYVTKAIYYWLLSDYTTRSIMYRAGTADIEINFLSDPNLTGLTQVAWYNTLAGFVMSARQRC